jgi:uncharacterized protein
MKIWLDTVRSEQYSVGDDECKEECKECPPTKDMLRERSEASFDIQNMRRNILQVFEPLHIREIFPEHVLVSNPIATGRIAVLDREAFALLELFEAPKSLCDVLQIQTDQLHERVEAVVALFYELGFLRETYHYPQRQDPAGKHTLLAWLHVTNACNLRCDYCYIDKTSESMADDTARKAIDAVFRSATKQGFKEVRLHYAGGEASLNISQVIAIHDYAVAQAQKNNLSLQACLFSNGVALSQRMIDPLKERNIGVMISLDGLGLYHDNQRPFLHGQGSFKYVERTIDRLVASNLLPSLSVTVSRRNLTGLPELIKYILDHGLPFTLNYYRDNSCSANMSDLQFEEEEMIRAMQAAFAVIERNLPDRCLLGSLVDKASLTSRHHRTCGVGRNYLAIDQNGGIAKCHADIKQTVATIDADDPLFLIQNDRTGLQGYSVDEKEGCRACEWRYWCSGGCPMLTFRLTGRSDIKSPNCNIYKALFPEVLYLEALRLLKYKSPIIF